jgi:hypothetical protein
MSTTTRILITALCVFAGGCAATGSQANVNGSIATASSSSSSQSSSGSHGLLAVGDIAGRDPAMSGELRGIPMPEPARDPGASAREMPTPQMPIPVRDHGSAAHGGMGYIY